MKALFRSRIAESAAVPFGVSPEVVANELAKNLFFRPAKFEASVDHNGELMGNKCYKPQKIYTKVNRVAPDLVVIFGDLRWRSVGQVGSDTVYTFENDTGPDDANHAQQGCYLFSHPSLPAKGRVDGPSLYDITPTILGQLGLPAPADLKGNPLI